MANEPTNNSGRDQSQTSSTPNQTMQHEQAKGGISSGERKSEQGEFDKNRQEKSAIGGQKENRERSETGEQGRARSELDQKSSAGQR